KINRSPRCCGLPALLRWREHVLAHHTAPRQGGLKRRPLSFSDANAVVMISIHVHTNQLKSRGGESAELGLRRYIGECFVVSIEGCVGQNGVACCPPTYSLLYWLRSVFWLLRE